MSTEGRLTPSSILLESVFDGILDAADGVLDLAFSLICLAFGLYLGVTSHITDTFFDFATDVLGGTVNAIFINHSYTLSCQFNVQ